MKSSNIGGQAVMEGIMMRHGDVYSVAVRKPDKEIEVKVEDYKSLIKSKRILGLPIIRGVFSFIDSLVVGTKCLMYSATFFEDEEEFEKRKQLTGQEKEREEAKKEKEDKVLMTVTVTLSIIFSVGLFMVLPYLLASLLHKVGAGETLVTIAEALVRILLFLLYMLLISKMEDIQRVFMYHGAEHKCINCIEHGLELNVENVRKSSRQHKRCGTSFLFFVMIVSIIFSFFITAESQVLRVLLRIAMLPLIAGVSYEIIRLAGNSDHCLVNFLSKPGLLIQNMTTKEPDDSMIEVAIRAVEAVFDWRAYENETFGTQYGEDAEQRKHAEQQENTDAADPKEDEV